MVCACLRARLPGRTAIKFPEPLLQPCLAGVAVDLPGGSRYELPFAHDGGAMLLAAQRAEALPIFFSHWE